MKPIISLHVTNNLGIIVFEKSGILYSNQVGGYACLHPEIEGVYMPLSDGLYGQEESLLEFFTGPKWSGWCTDEIDEQTADFIDNELMKSPYTKNIRANRMMMKASCEAWIYVRLIQCEELPIFKNIFGVLTWGNSD